MITLLVIGIVVCLLWQLSLVMVWSLAKHMDLYYSYDISPIPGLIALLLLIILAFMV